MIMGSNHAMAWWRILFILFCAFINLISISESHIVQNESWAFTHFLHGGARHILARWHQEAMGGHEGRGGTCSSGRWTTELGFSFDFGPMPGRAGGGKSTARPYVCGEESRSWMTFLSSFSSALGLLHQIWNRSPFLSESESTACRAGSMFSGFCKNWRLLESVKGIDLAEVTVWVAASGWHLDTEGWNH